MWVYFNANYSQSNEENRNGKNQRIEPIKLKKNYCGGGVAPHAGTLYGKSQLQICELKTVPASGQICDNYKSAINSKKISLIDI